MADKTQQQVVCFKVTASLLEAMKGIPNRSEFIRTAVLAALENVCPLCRGTGILTPKQMEHWHAFAETHAVRECEECHELHVVCEGGGRAPQTPAGPRRAGRPAATRRKQP